MLKQPDTVDYVKKGKAELAAGKYQDAASSFHEATKTQPKNPYLWYWRGLCYAGLNQYESAQREYIRAFRCAPTTNKKFMADLYCAWGDVHLKNGKFELALDRFNESVKHVQTNPLIYFGLAKAYKQLGQTDEALVQCQQAELKHMQQTSKVSCLEYCDKAMVHAAAGDSKLVVTVCDTASKLDAANFLPVMLRGYAYLALRDFKNADSDLKTAIQDSQLKFKCEFGLGLSQLKQDKPELARTNFINALESLKAKPWVMYDKLLVGLYLCRLPILPTQPVDLTDHKAGAAAASQAKPKTLLLEIDVHELHYAKTADDFSLRALANNPNRPITSAPQANIIVCKKDVLHIMENFYPHAISPLIRPFWIELLLAPQLQGLEPKLFKANFGDSPVFKQQLGKMINDLKGENEQLWQNACVRSIIQNTLLYRIFDRGIMQGTPVTRAAHCGLEPCLKELEKHLGAHKLELSEDTCAVLRANKVNLEDLSAYPNLQNALANLMPVAKAVMPKASATELTGLWASGGAKAPTYT